MNIVIIGAGGQGSVVADALLRSHEAGSGAWPIGFLDDSRTEPLLDLPILGPLASLPAIPHDGVVVAIGDNAVRRKVSEELSARGETLIVARHPWTSIAPAVRIGAGTMISAGVIVTPGVMIGRGVLLNTKAAVDHDSVIGDFSHVSPGATLGANVVLGEEVFVGLGASILSGCRVGSRSIIGAGAVVVRDIPENVVAYGVPARVKRIV